jgi:dihydrodipicolinate synthase/N-acetylneuraminate lyase
MVDKVEPSIMVPALTPRNGNGEIDRKACLTYAEQASQTWIDLFMLAGSIGEGFALTSQQRAWVLETWLERVPAERLLACAWSIEDLSCIQRLGVRPVMVLKNLADQAEALQLLSSLPKGSFVYSHPRYTKTTLTPSVAEEARARNTLPAGAKLSKVSLDDISALRTATGDAFALYDGRSRHIQRSVAAGATGVVVVPLSILPEELPGRSELPALQDLINRIQEEIDSISSVSDQASMLLHRLYRQL